MIFLVLLEGALTAVSPVALWLRQRDQAPVEGRVIACLGDSVTMGYGLPRDQSWPAALQRWMEARSLDGTVVNRAAGGSKIGHVVSRDATWLTKLPAKSRPLTLLMVGHNDLLSWGGMGGGMGGGVGGNQRGMPPPPGAPTWEPRIFRLFQWMRGVATEELPRDRISDEDVALFADQVRVLAKATRGRGGQLVLLTYVVPGQAPSGAEAQWSAVLEAKREHQLAINDLLRKVADAEQLPLLDLARGVPVSGTWDPAIFLDDIHLSPEGGRRVAEAVGGWLLVEGLLGP